MLPFGGGDSRIDEGEGAGREGDLARADAEEGTELPELGPSLARDEVGSWVAVTVKVRHRQQEEQGLPLGGGAEVVVDLLHNLCVSGACWEGERRGEGVGAQEDAHIRPARPGTARPAQVCEEGEEPTADGQEFEHRDRQVRPSILGDFVEPK